jgi:hypothetical protein
MVRISRLTAVLAAIVMTAFTFGPIGVSSAADTHLHPGLAVGSQASAAVVNTVALLGHVLHRFA